MNDEHDDPHHSHHDHHDHGAMIADFRRRLWVSLALTVPILLLSPLIQQVLGLREALAFAGDQYVHFAFATAVFFYGGWPFLTGLKNELAARQPGMMTLIGLAVGVAYLYSSAVVFGLPGKVFFWELATLIDVMLLGHWIEMRSVAGASGALEELVRLMPSDAHRVTESGEVEDVSVSDLVAGDRVQIRPGEKIPVDGVIRDGRSTLDQSLITGESKPVSMEAGNEVIGGAVNGEGALTVEVQKTGEDTYLSQVVRMVDEAQQSRSRTQDLANRAAAWLTYIAISAGVITLFAWLVVIGQSFDFSLERMVTVMVITCPHALGLAVPLVVAVSTSLGARSGLLIRDRAAFERARNLDTVVFDKTGTLTEGRFGVSDVIALADQEEDQILAWAAALEAKSEHPIGRGVVQEAADRDLQVPGVEDFSNLPGQGVEGRVSGRLLRVVSPGYLESAGDVPTDERIRKAMKSGKTLVFVLEDQTPIGAIALADIVRDGSREAITELKAMGIDCMMLTGDNQAVAQSVAEELGLDDFFAEVLPDQKADRIRDIKQRGRRVAMVGDGVNDAPALVEADLGIAIGAGTDVAVEAGDIVLVRSDPRDVVAIVELSRSTYRKMIQNLFWATGYNVIAIPLAAGVAYGAGILLSPALGAALMSVSTVIVAINAKLLGRSGLSAEYGAET